MYIETERLKSWIAQMIDKMRQKLLRESSCGNINTALKPQLFCNAAEKAILPNLMRVQVQEAIRDRGLIFPGGTL